jgi:protein CpxP
MKKFICFLVVSLFCIGAIAQNDPSAAKSSTPEQRAERITNWMNKKLTLTADQKAKVYDINLKYAKLNQETRTNDADNKKAMRQELKASEKEREDEFKAILTPDQFKSFQAAKQGLLERGRERRKS